MNAWADGLNFYLDKHPEVKPRVITRFEPWMALTFSEGSIGGDIETVNLDAARGVLRQGPEAPALRPRATTTASASRRGRTAFAIAPSQHGGEATRCC